MTLETLVLVFAGGVLSVLQEIWDGWLPWLGEQSKFVKRLVTLGTYLVGGAAIFGLACLSWLGLVAPGVVLFCDMTGVYALLEVVFLLAIGGQVTHLLVKKS